MANLPLSPTADWRNVECAHRGSPAVVAAHNKSVVSTPIAAGEYAAVAEAPEHVVPLEKYIVTAASA